LSETAVVILNYNGQQLLEQYLPSLLTHRTKEKFYVIDNGSTDDSVEFIEKVFPDVNVVRLDKNYGFSGGYNKGLSQIQAKYYVLINSDIEVTSNWLHPLVEYLEEHPRVAAAQPEILSARDKRVYDYAGAAGGYIDFLGYPFCRGRVFNHIEKYTPEYSSTVPVFWTSGACMIIRSDIYWNAGGLDEDYFAHMEEIDLCWRIHRLGFELFCIPESRVFHLGGATLDSTNPRKTFLNFRNSLWTLIKNYPTGKGSVLILFRLLLDLVSIIKFIFEGKTAHGLAVVRADLSFLKSLPKRLREKPSFPYPKIDSIYTTPVVSEFYLRKKVIFNGREFSSPK
jgi:hypothetical protein